MHVKCKDLEANISWPSQTTLDSGLTANGGVISGAVAALAAVVVDGAVAFAGPALERRQLLPSNSFKPTPLRGDLTQAFYKPQEQPLTAAKFRHSRSNATQPIDAWFASLMMSQKIDFFRLKTSISSICQENFRIPSPKRGGSGYGPRHQT